MPVYLPLVCEENYDVLILFHSLIIVFLKAQNIA